LGTGVPLLPIAEEVHPLQVGARERRAGRTDRAPTLVEPLVLNASEHREQDGEARRSDEGEPAEVDADLRRSVELG
jgi:hypothetical protein